MKKVFISLFFLLFAGVTSTLKVIGVIDCPWCAVLAPAWVPTLIYTVILDIKYLIQLKQVSDKLGTAK